MNKILGACLLSALAIPAVARAGQDAPPPRVLQLSFAPDGTVSLRAQNVTVRDILAEWKRQCGCAIVNGEKMPGGLILMPLQFPSASQSVVLESLLRPAAGYVLTPKRAGSTSVSSFETIFIVATSNPTASYSGASNYVPVSSPMITPGSPDDEIPPITPRAGPTPNGPYPGVPVPNGPGTGQPASPGGLGTPRPASPGVFVPLVPMMPATPVAPGTAGTPSQSPMTPASPPAGRQGTGPFLTPVGP